MGENSNREDFGGSVIPNNIQKFGSFWNRLLKNKEPPMWVFFYYPGNR
jgi:hypothetical protein